MARTCDSRYDAGGRDLANAIVGRVGDVPVPSVVDCEPEWPVQSSGRGRTVVTREIGLRSTSSDSGHCATARNFVDVLVSGRVDVATAIEGHITSRWNAADGFELGSEIAASSDV
jgi:hypothetical protein